MSKFITGAVVAALLAFLPGPAYATSGGTSCPGNSSKFVLWDVSAEPYGADNYVDEQGNNDGWVCAKPIYVVTDEEGNPFQIYLFGDNKF